MSSGSAFGGGQIGGGQISVATFHAECIAPSM